MEKWYRASLSNQVSIEKKNDEAMLGAFLVLLGQRNILTVVVEESVKQEPCKPQILYWTGQLPLSSPFAKFTHNVVPASGPPPLFSPVPEQ